MSLRARLLAAFAYALVVVIVALLVPLGINLDKRLNAEIENEASGQAQVVATAAAGALGNPRKLARLADNSARDLDARVLLVKRNGRVLADSATDRTLGRDYRSENRPELSTALAGAPAQGQRRSDTLDQNLLFSAVPITDAGRVRGAVRVTQDVEVVDAAVRDDVIALIGIGLLALAIGLGVAWILAGSIARPLLSLAGVARRMAGGNLDVRAEPTGSREQVEVSRAFNEMAERLGAVLDSQREFVANASHQLRTPLTGLQLRLEAAAAKTRAAGTARDLEAAERETERLSTLVADLLTLAASEEATGTREEAGLSRAAAEALERWRDAASETGHEIELTGDGEVRVRASGGDLALILDNLIENAIKYSSPGSPVRVGWRLAHDDATLAVTSLGSELSDAELEQAFKRFYRGSRAKRGEGTGLGLAIVAALAGRWGGAARLRNAPGGVVAEVVLVPATAPPA